MWVTCGTVYGETIGPTHPNHLNHNEMLVRAVASQICFHSTGLRVIAGDWNIEDGDIPSFQMIRDAGFEDLQTLANQRCGQSIELTCKLSTRKDFVFISPELQALLRRVVVLQDVWADHAVLAGHFEGNIHSVPRYQWSRPHACSWPEAMSVDDVDWPDPTIEPSASYHAFWQKVENAARTSSPQPIPSNQLGRGRPVHLRTKVGKPHAPLSGGRPGDVAPLFHGISVLHSQWFRQLRRLQAFMRLARSVRIDNLTERAANAWGSIGRAKGFNPNFATWWKTCKFRVHLAPAILPLSPPDASTAAAIYDSFHMAVRDLEKQLRKQCSSYARLRRATCPNTVFQDIRRSSADSVNLLIRPLKAAVVVVGDEFGALTVDSDCPWDPSRPVLCNGAEFQLIHQENQFLFLDSVDGISIGDSLTQMRMTGHIDDLCREFTESWKQRWMRHDKVPLSQWSQIISFAQQHLHPSACQHQPLNAHSLADEIKCRKTRSAAGMDGVHLSDLKAMPENVLAQLCRIYHEAESSGKWPQQVLNGSVSSLAKCASPQTALDFRPITIFSLVYRLWSSHHAKSILRELDCDLPSDLFGSRPGHWAGQVWSHLCWMIEQSFLTNQELSGVQADIQKAFNHLPREVVFAAAVISGLPQQVLVGWAGAVSGFARYFRIRDSYSAPVPSCTGYPEGCALSCVAMIHVNQIFHAWFSAMTAVSPVSFVDDWQLLCSGASSVPAALAHLDNLCQHLDLLLDRKKTFVWSTSATGRRALKQAGLRVELGGTILGAQAQFSLKHLTQTLTTRAESLAPLFAQLRTSQAPYHAKLNAIRTAAWPRGLHGCLAVKIGAHVFSQLRTGAMKGLQAEGSGVNPMLHLGLIEPPMCDPAFWTFMTSVRQLRDCGHPDLVEPTLVELSMDPLNPCSNGITTTMLDRLHWMGWSVRPTGQVCDQFGTFSLFHVHPDELFLRASWSWKAIVSQQVKHRQGLASMHLADTHDTRTWLDILSTQDRALFRKILNGAIFTANFQAKWDADTNPECPFCECTDSRFHRWWICDAFQRERVGMSAAVFQSLPALPESLTSFGWSLQACTWVQWKQYLADLPTCFDSMPLQARDVLDVFTDGTCHAPQDVELRFAAWACVSVMPGDFTGGVVLGRGILPGICQTVFRAELYAVKVAMQTACRLKRGLRLWVDCQAVVSGLRRLLQTRLRPKINSRHSDLWVEIFEMLEFFQERVLQISKVPAHVSCDQCETDFAEWCCVHNNHVDRVANLANMMRPPDFWDRYNKHVHAVQAAREVSRQVQRVQLNISKAVVRKEKQQAETEDVDKPVERPNPQPPPWAPLPAMTAIPEWVPLRYGAHLVENIRQWFWIHAASLDRPRWVSQYQLYIDFMGYFQCGGPLHVGLNWLDPRDVQESEVVPHHFKRRCGWWAKVFRAAITHSGVPMQSVFCRPDSRMLSLHTGCVWVPWPEVRIQAVDDWIASYLQHPATRNGDSLIRLPGAMGPRCLARVRC